MEGNLEHLVEDVCAPMPSLPSMYTIMKALDCTHMGVVTAASKEPISPSIPHRCCNVVD